MAEAIVSGLINQLSENEEFEELMGTLLAIKPELEDAERRQFTEADVRKWLDELKDVSYHVEEALDEWNFTILRSKIQKQAFAISKNVCFSMAGFSLGFSQFSRLRKRRNIALMVKKLGERLSSIAIGRLNFRFSEMHIETELEQPWGPNTHSFVDESDVYIYGREEDKSILVRKLLSENRQEGFGPEIMSIVGMGGIGKTTLAKLVYNDEMIQAHFQLKCWVCVSAFDVKMVFKQILQSTPGWTTEGMELVIMNDLLERIDVAIAGKNLLLVLDDVRTGSWDKWSHLWQAFRFGSAFDKILVTSRTDYTMRATTVVVLRTLSVEDCWSLFSRKAFFGRDSNECKQLEEIGRRIVSKCNGLPLAAKSLGGLMRYKKTREQWEDVLLDKVSELEDYGHESIFPPFWCVIIICLLH